MSPCSLCRDGQLKEKVREEIHGNTKLSDQKMIPTSVSTFREGVFDQGLTKKIWVLCSGSKRMELIRTALHSERGDHNFTTCHLATLPNQNPSPFTASRSICFSLGWRKREGGGCAFK